MEVMEGARGQESGASAPDRTGILLALGALGLIALFGLYLWKLAPIETPDFGDAAYVLPVAASIPDFRLVDHRGQPFDRSRLQGHWSLLFFGYTYCPDVCPMTLQSLARVRKLLDADGESGEPPQMVFISVDPKRDTTERLAQYVAFFHPALVGATGEPEQIDRLTGAVGAFYRQAEGGTSDDYRVDHTSSVFLIDPQVRLHAVLHEPEEPRAFVDLLSKVEAFERSS